MNKIILFMLLISCTCYAENIDPYETENQYAWGENIGWLNAEPNVHGEGTVYGVQVEWDKLTGWIWAENIGWINLSCENTSSCGTVDYGVTNDGSGNLSGFAWAENVGWISFSCDNTSSCGSVDYGVTIDSDGKFDGYAWGENIGWINFGITEYYVMACKVKLEDFANFASEWLQSGSLPADLDGSGDVGMGDLQEFVDYWLRFCPDGWQLK